MMARKIQAHIVQATRIGQLITEAMESQGISIRDIALELGITYEHIRRIAKGEGLPSKLLLRELCGFLGIDRNTAEQAVTADRIQKEHGDLSLILVGKDPSLQPIERVWKNLTEIQKKAIIATVESFSKQNRITDGKANR